MLFITRYIFHWLKRGSHYSTISCMVYMWNPKKTNLFLGQTLKYGLDYSFYTKKHWRDAWLHTPQEQKLKPLAQELSYSSGSRLQWTVFLSNPSDNNIFVPFCMMYHTGNHYSLHVSTVRLCTGLIFAKERAVSVPSAESTVCLFCSFKDLILRSGAQECKWDESSKLSLNTTYPPSLIQSNS